MQVGRKPRWFRDVHHDCAASAALFAIHTPDVRLLMPKHLAHHTPEPIAYTFMPWLTDQVGNPFLVTHFYPAPQA